MIYGTRPNLSRVKQAGEAEWGGCEGYFTDPDGYLWEVAWAPSTSTKTDPSTSPDAAGP